MSISDLGNGSWILGTLLLIFAIIGLINAFVAFIMWFRAFTEWLTNKSKSPFLFWCFIIVVTSVGMHYSN